MKTKTKQALASAKSAHVAAKAAKVAKVAKVARVASAQYKLVKASGADRALGHGGVYNLRATDVSANIVVARAKGASKLACAIFTGKHGACFLMGAFVGRTLNVGNIGIDTARIKRVVYFGSVDGARAFVKSKGDVAAKVATHYSDASHVYGAGSHYSIALVGKQLVRDEYRTNDNGAKFVDTHAN